MPPPTRLHGSGGALAPARLLPACSTVASRRPRGGQSGFADPPLIEGQLQVPQILAGEFPGPLQHGDEGRQVVAGAAAGT